MLTFAKAWRIAEAWVAILSDDEWELMREAIIAKPYGWIFFYQSKDFLRDRSKFSAQLMGNAPFLVDRGSGEIRVFGTALAVEDYLSHFESDLSPARFYAVPELPSW